jgi:serine/threonine protein kinase
LNVANFGQSGRVKVGMASKTGAHRGTERYHPPESEKDLFWDFTSDLWSIGAVLFDIIENFTWDEITPPLEFSSEKCDATLKEFVTSCLRIQPSKRPKAAELKQFKQKLGDSLGSHDAGQIATNMCRAIHKRLIATIWTPGNERLLPGAAPQNLRS